MEKEGSREEWGVRGLVGLRGEVGGNNKFFNAPCKISHMITFQLKSVSSPLTCWIG